MQRAQERQPKTPGLGKQLTKQDIEQRLDLKISFA